MEKYSKLRLKYPLLVHVDGYKGDAGFSLIEVFPLALCKVETNYLVSFIFTPPVSCWVLIMGW